MPVSLDTLNDVDPDLNFYDSSGNKISCDFCDLDNFCETMQKNSNSLKLLNFNIRSYNANSDSFFCQFDKPDQTNI